MKRTDANVGTRFIDSTKLRQNLSSGTPQVRALRRSMVPDEADPSRSVEDRERRVKYSKLKSLSDIIANNINANTDLRMITPYIAKAELIWKTLLLYPNGAQDEILTYDTLDSKFKNSKLHTELATILKRYCTSDYKIESKLPLIVSELTTGSGAYIDMQLSRPALDHIINGQQRFDGDDSVSGTEGLRSNVETIRRGIEAEFVKNDSDVNTKSFPWLAKNKGLVKNPDEKGSDIHGLEALLNGNASYAGTEYFALGEEFGITITDNTSVLALADINRNKTNRIIEDVMGVESLQSIIRKRRKENNDNTVGATSEVKGATKAKKGQKSGVNTTEMSDAQIEALQNDLYTRRSYVRKSVMSIRLSDSYNVKPFGIPLNFQIPTEAFIPVHLNGDPTKQIGGYVLIDPTTGEFLKSSKDYTFNQSIKGQAGKVDTPNPQGSTNGLISRLRSVQEGNECDFDMSEFATLGKDQIEKALIQALASGASGKNVTVSLEAETLKIYLARAFKQQGVRTLYIPAESYTYFAFNYNRMGIGQSLTTRAKMFIARLAALDVADALANLDKAQTRNELTISLEEDDPDPENTIEMARAKWFMANPTLHSIMSAGSLSVPDIVEAMRQQSLVVRVEANNNQYMPAPTVNVQQIERTGFGQIDDSSRQNLLSSIASTFMLQRSWLDDKEDGNNFQVEALAEQEMLRNQTVLWSNDLSRMLTDAIRKHVALNGVLLNELIDVIERNKEYQKPDSGDKIEVEGGDDESVIEVILADFLNNLIVTLPQPASMESTSKLKDKIAAVNDLVEGWMLMSGGINILKTQLQALGMDIAGMDEESIAATIKGVYLIDLYKRMNLPMPFDNVINKGKEGGLYSLLNEIDQYSENVGMFLTAYAKNWTKRSESLKKKFEKLEPKEEVTNDYGDTPPSNDVPATDGDDASLDNPDDTSNDNPDENPDDQQPADENNGDDSSLDDDNFNIGVDLPK